MAIRINRVYTRTGDGGKTGLVGGHRVDKDDLRIECFGTVDELNATVGLARLHCVGGPATIVALDAILARVQNELFNLGSQLATRAEDLRPTQPVIADRHVQALESEIDAHNADLPELRSFVLPGGGALGAHLHLCRTVCRRAERLAVSLAHKETVPEVAIRYLNRLSDALFVWARFAAMATGQAEVLWQPEST
ncbi:MAG TPA: cob(I)yrinic acid a,c-diamide adenosyltransferase [Pseudomonadota bacterium]|nr:cob(I)yrinic acid a,c-diamide adenosyltransferase [Pseudomonadota bacterium]